MRSFPAIAALLICLALLPFQASAETASGYAITALSFRIQGRTQETALRRALEAEGPIVGSSFATKEALETFVAEKRQLLANNRVLGSVESEIAYSERSGGAFDASVTFAVEDTRNLIVLPEPKYDSNAGLSLTLKGRDYDFLGSMRSLELDLGYTSESTDNRYFGLETNFVLPFEALDSEMGLGFYEDAAFWLGGTVKSASAASLGYAIPGLGFPASVKAVGGFYRNADLPNEDLGDSALDEVDPSYLSGSLIGKATIPLGFSVGALGAASFTPRLTATESWWPGRALLYQHREGLSLEAKGALDAGRVIWAGNLQTGSWAEFQLVGTDYVNESDFVGEAKFTYETHWAFGQDSGLPWGIAARLVGIGRPLGSFPSDDIQDLGSYLRGIVDARIEARSGAFLNFAVPVKLFDFPTHAIIGSKLLDFELQASPFVDAAYIPGDSASAWASAGLEILVFPKAFRSFIVRASFGYDLLHSSSSGSYGPYELYIGTGLFLDPVKTPYEEWVDK